MDENVLNFFNILIINQNFFKLLIYILYLLLGFYCRDLKLHFNE